MKVEFSGHIYLNLPKLLSVQDGYTFGQKLAQIEKTAKKRFIYLTDEEIYEALKSLLESKDYYLDEKPDEEFIKKFLNTK
jgi:hypothetical protein